MKNLKARVIAFYLPQFHPIPENDKWWGKGFTEWTNVGKAKPLFKGHYQPRVPADLGYYDLRIPEVREAQAQMAREAGIEGFMYWHYWFGNGKQLMSNIFDEVLVIGKPDFPFCLAWANHSWSNKTWLPKDQYKSTELLVEQLYPGIEDYKKHFFYVLKAFKDKRYIQIDGKPVFMIYAPLDFKEVNIFIELWQKLAKENGLDGVYFIGQTSRNHEWSNVLNLGFNAVCRAGLQDAVEAIKGKIRNSGLGFLRNYSKFIFLNRCKYSRLINHLVIPDIDKMENVYPTIISNYDHSPRSGRKALIVEGSTPDLFKKLIIKSIENISHKKEDHKIIILRSWNEWAEGNYLEPDLKFGTGYLDALKDALR